MNKFAIALIVFSTAITMPALAGDIRQFTGEPGHGRLMQQNAIALYNSAEQAILFVLTTQDGSEKRFNIPGNARWQLSDGASSQYMIRIFTVGDREVQYPLSAGNRYKIYWNSDAKVWDVALFREQ